MKRVASTTGNSDGGVRELRDSKTRINRKGRKTGSERKKERKIKRKTKGSERRFNIGRQKRGSGGKESKVLGVCTRRIDHLLFLLLSFILTWIESLRGPHVIIGQMFSSFLQPSLLLFLSVGVFVLTGLTSPDTARRYIDVSRGRKRRARRS